MKNVVAAALLILSMSGPAALSMTTPTADRRLDPAAIADAIVGQPITLHTDTLDAHDVVLERGGKIVHAVGDAPGSGRWSMRNDALCLDVAGSPNSGCLAVIRHAGEHRYFYLFSPSGVPHGEIKLAAAK